MKGFLASVVGIKKKTLEKSLRKLFCPLSRATQPSLWGESSQNCWLLSRRCLSVWQQALYPSFKCHWGKGIHICILAQCMGVTSFFFFVVVVVVVGVFFYQASLSAWIFLWRDNKVNSIWRKKNKSTIKIFEWRIWFSNGRVRIGRYCRSQLKHRSCLSNQKKKTLRRANNSRTLFWGKQTNTKAKKKHTAEAQPAVKRHTLAGS